MKSQPIQYKDTLAMPGSDLYKHLSENKPKKAEESYKETNQRHRELMAKIDQQDKARNVHGH